MGRKSLPKSRRTDPEKTNVWLQILFNHFQEHGLKGLTMDDMADILGKSKTTVYGYFPTREVLMEQMVDMKLREIGAVREVLTNNRLSYLERYFEVLQYLAHHIGGISTVFLADLKSTFPDLWEQIEAFLDEITLMLDVFYREGMANGQFNELHPAILTQSDRLFFRAIASPEFLSSSGLTLQEAFEQYLKLKFFGLIRR